MTVRTLKEDQGIRIDQGLVDRTQALLSDFTYHLDHDSMVDGELRVKLAKAELCLFKVASLMQKMVDERRKTKEPDEPYILPDDCRIIVVDNKSK